MSKAKDIIEQLSFSADMYPLKRDAIMQAFTSKLAQLDMEEVQVEDVDIGLDGITTVTFSDEEGELEVEFFVDEDDDAVYAMIIDDDNLESDDPEDEITLVDLTPLNPSIIMDNVFGSLVNLVELSWLNKSAMVAILIAGDIEREENISGPIKQDAFGNVMTQAPTESYDTDEAFTRVVRGGKVQRIALVRKKRRKVLSGKQKAGFRKAALKRRAKKSQIGRKRKKSLALRGRRSIKKRAANSRLKVQGGADRKR